MECINCKKEITTKFLHQCCKSCVDYFYDKCRCGRLKKKSYQRCYKCYDYRKNLYGSNSKFDFI